MKNSKRVFFAGLILAASAAHAELMNISATATHSASDLQGIACTIVGTTGPLYRGSKILFVFAESAGNGRDPKVRVSSMKYDLVVANEDWRKPWFLNGEAFVHDAEILYSSFLRTPYKPTDAALIYFADPGEAVCAYTNEQTSDGGQYAVQIAFNDITAAFTAAGFKVAPSGVAGLADPLWMKIDTQKKLHPIAAQE
jgi:hypothetical protein